MEMYSDLRKFDKAKLYMPEHDEDAAKALMKKQAEWFTAAKDPTLALDILLAAGEDLQAIDIMGENGMTQRLIDMGRKVPKSETEVVGRVAYWLRKMANVPLASEMYQKVGGPAGGPTGVGVWLTP
jgi:intraflagellar transport protein 122